MNKSGEDDNDVVGVGSESKKRFCGGSGSSSSETVALAYLNSVKHEAPTDLYVKLLVLLQDFRACRIDATSVGLRIKKLFAGYRDLILGFNWFLPDWCKISLDDEDDEIKDAEKEDMEEKEEDCDDEDEKFKSGKFGEALRFVNKVKLRFQNDDDKHVFRAFLDIWEPNQKKMIKVDDCYYKAAQLLGHHPDLLQDFDRLLGSHATPPVQKGSDPQPSSNGSDLSVDGPEREIKTRLVKQGLDLCHKVKQVLNVSDYQDLLKKLKQYDYEKITRDDLEASVSDALGSDQNLVEEFNKFIRAHEEQSNKLFKLEEEKKEQKQRQYVQKVDPLKHKKTKKLNPSYQRLPTSRQRSSKNKNGHDEVLNHGYVCSSANFGNESYSSKQRQINKHEKILFKCEDDMYEIDVLMQRISLTIEKVKELWNDMVERKINLESGFKIEDYLSILNRRCIERLYGDYGLEMMDVLQEKPIEALPVILMRLEQKQQDLTMCKEGFNELCRDVYAKIQQQQKSSV